MKTELVTVDSLSGLTLDELKEMANTFGEKSQQAAKKTVQDAITAGTALLAAKAKLVHGGWIRWLGQNWDYSQPTAWTYMTLAANYKRLQFDQPKSIREAIGMIAAESDEPSGNSGELVPRAERKEGQVVVSEPDHCVDVNNMVDADPSPAPPTNRKAAAGSRKKPEVEKPATRPVVPEVLPAEPETSVEDRVRHCLTELEDDTPKLDGKSRKVAAKILRKLADKLDPPEESPRPEKVPTIAQLIRTIPDEVGTLKLVIERWARHKQSLQGKARVRSMESWQTMLEQMLKACDKHGVSEVSESIRASIANGYTGWDIQLKSSNGKGNGNGRDYQTPGQRRESVTANSFAAIRAAAAADRAAAGGGEG
jgi:hypothetical protein